MRPVHSRQFVVNSSDTSPVDFFVSKELSNQHVLHYDPELTVIQSPDGVFIGDIPFVGDGATLDEARRSGGRWASVWPIARQSAMGLLSLYWSQVDGEIVIASSSALAAASANADRTTYRVGDYRPNWIVPPLSGYLGVQRLIRDQQVDLESGEIQFDETNRLHSDGESLDRRAQRLYENLKLQLRSASAIGNLKIALTSGYDSRMVFAAAIAEGLEFETYTQSERSLEGPDMAIAARLSKDAGVRHHAIGPGQPNKLAGAIWDAHTGGAIRDADRRFLRLSMFDLFDEEDILVRGGMFEIGSANWDSIFPGDDSVAMPDPEEFDRLVTWAFRLLPLTKSYVLPALRQWREFRLANETSIGWRDHLYTDQRGAGWLGGIEQGLGLLLPRSIQLADTSVAVGAMTWEPTDAEHGRGREVEMRTIGLCDEKLLEIPFNPPTPTSRVSFTANNLSNLARGEARTAIAMLKARRVGTS